MYPKYLLKVAASCLCLAASARSWETNIHNQIGFMADEQLDYLSKYVVGMILEPEYNGSMGKAAAWADGVRKTTHRYSYGWHFISAKDDPPNNCGLFYDRDCQEGGCVVQQIANQTDILAKCIYKLMAGGDGGTTECSEALKWVIHFAGDVAQPLHTSERAYGGNIVKVVFNGTNTNLHSVWDKEILYAAYGAPKGFSNTELDNNFKNLLARLILDDYRTPRATWNGYGYEQLDYRRGTYYPEKWAQDSNFYACDYAYSKLINGSDLWNGEDRYAVGALPIIEQQVAKASWRLAGWINALVKQIANSADDGSTTQRRLTMQERRLAASQNAALRVQEL